MPEELLVRLDNKSLLMWREEVEQLLRLKGTLFLPVLSNLLSLAPFLDYSQKSFSFHASFCLCRHVRRIVWSSIESWPFEPRTHCHTMRTLSWFWFLKLTFWTCLLFTAHLFLANTHEPTWMLMNVCEHHPLLSKATWLRQQTRNKYGSKMEWIIGGNGFHRLK